MEEVRVHLVDNWVVNWNLAQLMMQPTPNTKLPKLLLGELQCIVDIAEVMNLK